MIISSKTKINTVIGYPLDHSLSPILHNFIYQKNGLDAVMLALPHRDINFLIKIIRDLPIHLAAVTMPHKQAVVKRLDWIDKTARTIGAVNLIINGNGKLCGYNTDVAGIERAFRGTRIKGKSALILGAGGAARAAAYCVKSRGGRLFYLNRTPEKAVRLAEEFGGKLIEKNNLERLDIDVIINATPVGMAGQNPDCLLSADLFNGRQCVFDMVYNPIETKLLKLARLAGARAIPGLEMFIGQALMQIQLWLGRKVNDDNYFGLLKKSLGFN